MYVNVNDLINIAREQTKFNWFFYRGSDNELVFHDELEKNSLYVFLKEKIVVTRLYHDKSNRFTYLLRENIDPEILITLLKNPRAHTGKGKYIKKDDFYKIFKTQELSKS